MADNLIVIENQKPGASRAVWDAPTSPTRIEGFATDISVDTGDSISFKINVNAPVGVDVPYHVEIYRLGYYGGSGATLVTTINGLTGTAQPNPITDSRGIVDAGNWAVSATWDTPQDATSGVYIARVVRDDTGESNQIPFILREDDLRADGTRSDILLQTSDTTWQAYNGWGGNNGVVGGNLYGGFVQPDPLPADAGPLGTERAYGVSYNRPFLTRDGGGVASGAQDYVFGADYAAISWLEKNGYDVSYISGVDTDRLGASYLLGHQAFLSVGHDEYWSGAQRANVEAARDAGVNLLFWGGNDVYWKTRYEPSIDGTATDYRTLISYKETWANYTQLAGPGDYSNIDPSNQWTGTWRDIRFVDSVDSNGINIAQGAVPENALTGQLFYGDGANVSTVGIDVPAALGGLRLWRDTTVAAGGAADIAPGIIGYEWNRVPVDAYRPAGLILLSETQVNWPDVLVDQGSRTEPGTGTHSLSLYRAPSGALVFAAGTVFWSWGLSNEHDSSPYGVAIQNLALQQFTVNLFADMGIQPGVTDTLLSMAGLVRASQSTDTVAATATLADVPNEVTALQTYVLSGTATDDDGNAATADGKVALVEVSFDNGLTWTPASGQSNWTYAWTPSVTGPVQIIARAIDDSLNLPDVTGVAPDIVTVTPPASFSLFEGGAVTASAFNDGTGLELGVRFSPTVAGTITELRYFRSVADSADTDVRAGHLWNANGTLLATATFTSLPGQSGWQTATLAAPVLVQAGASYTASYKTQNFYVSSENFFSSNYTDPFNALNAPAAGNGVYVYGSGTTIPTDTYRASNYWVDVTYRPGVPNNTAPAITSAANFAMVENQTTVGNVTASDANGDPLAFSIVGGADAFLFNIAAATGRLSFLAAPNFEAPGDAGGNNVYDLVVGVSDGIAPVVTQAVKVTVTDQNPEVVPVQTYSLFSAAPVSGPVLSDGIAVELGVRVTATQAVTVTELRYYRAANDANDTDIRAGHLWDAQGNLLSTVTFTSTPGQSGWQSADLLTPVDLVAGQTYTVSYRTQDNYLATQGYFSTSHSDASGALTAPAGANGVYAYGSGLTLPTGSFQSSNYWVDLGVVIDQTPNVAPVVTSSNLFSIPENQLSVGTVTASDPDGNALSYAIAGGVDAARFVMNASTGALSFVFAPNFEAPADSGANNVYNLNISVSDSIAAPVTQAIQVTVTDVNPEGPLPTIATLFGPTDTPANTFTSDPTDYELGTAFTVSQAGSVSELRYFRGVPDAADTDVRTLTLWTSTGTALANVTVQSNPGNSGWQTGTLATPVALTPGAGYVVSYGTTQNYVVTNGYFNAPHAGTDGIINAPGGQNGLFAVNTTGAFPTQSYQATNYWVDVGFVPEPIVGAAPLFSGIDGSGLLSEMVITPDPDPLVF